jgi:hypothetical protein
MKTLIFALIFPVLAMAAAGDPNEVDRISDADISRKLVGVARDIQNEQILKNATDLQGCRDKFQENPQASGAITTLENCIKGKVGTGATAAALSDKLDLETYKLIPSKSVQNVTKYLTKKLYLELTGVDIEEQDVAKKIQAMKFSNKKQVDHKDFYALYKNQIAKNALYEVSRFCFLDLRRTGPPKNQQNEVLTTFIEHWDNLDEFANKRNLPQDDPYRNLLTDSGEPKFEDSQSGSANDPNQSYTNMMRNIFNGPTTQIQSERLQNFFFYCGQKINELCKDFEDKCIDQTTKLRRRDCGTPASTNPAAPAAPIAGSNACLAKTRLTAFRSAMKASDKIVEEFDKNAGSDISIMLNPNEVVKRYQRGTGSGNEKSLNELTNNASIDFYKASEQDNSDDEAQKCIDSDGRDCEQFEIVDDSVARIKTNNEIVYEAKRLAEMERVKDLAQKGGLNLETYIDTYYPDLKEIAKNSPNELVAEIGKKWDARREALKKEIQNRIGDRQITETEAAKAASSGTPFANKGQETAVENAKQALNEKTRLAQIVFFNNIISSSLNLQTQSGQSLGRNIQAFDNEVDSAENDVQSGLFDNLRTSLKTTGGSSGGSSQLTGNESVTNIDFLDQFIGIPKDP